MTSRRALIIGWRGGVGSALLSLIGGHPAGRRLSKAMDGIVLAATRVDEASLATLLREHRVDLVIEVADVDTLAFSAVCAEHGADYVTASMQRQACGDEELTMIGACALLPEHRPDVGDASHLIGAGMNPGVVNALVFAALEELGCRVARPPTLDALDIYAIYVTEQDTTELAGSDLTDELPMSWSPEHALDELLEPHAMYVANGSVQCLPHRPHERLYRARCGTHEVAAMVVPHEELVTIGHRFAPVECAFFYAVLPAARAALRRFPERKPDEWRTRKLYPPYETALQGHDRVGITLCSRTYGELWVGFDTSMELACRYGTNATLLQAASGVLAGCTLVGTRRGVHVIEDLDWRRYVAIVEEILGPRCVHHRPDAPVRELSARAIG